jgi:hypothetical protein
MMYTQTKSTRQGELAVFKKLISRLLDIMEPTTKKTVLDEYFDKYNEEQRLMNMRTVYTAGDRPSKPGVR